MDFTFITIMLTKTLLSGLLLIASLTKLTAPSQSMDLLRQFGLNSRQLSLIALILSAVELVIVVSLLSSITSAIAFISAAAIFGISFVFIIISLRRGSNASCGCFGQFTNEYQFHREYWEGILHHEAAEPPGVSPLNFDAWLNTIAERGKRFIESLRNASTTVAFEEAVDDAFGPLQVVTVRDTIRGTDQFLNLPLKSNISLTLKMCAT